MNQLRGIQTMNVTKCLDLLSKRTESLDVVGHTVMSVE